jgi:DNA-binding transcriptional LysR family regulator
MEADQLRFFVAIARKGHFAAVARLEGVAPSSISRAIAGLEEELGVTLFDRTTRRVSLTEAGEAYLRRIEPLVDELEVAADEARGAVRGPKGALRVLAPVSFAQLNVVPLLAGFLARHPGVRLDLRLDDAPLDLVEQRIDLAIRLGPLADSSYVSKRLATMRSRVCASRGYLARRGTPVSPFDLKGHECLLLDMPGFSSNWRFRAANGAEQAVAVSGPLRTSNAVALKECAIAGAGVILQGEWIVGREIAEGALVDLFPRHEATATTFDNAAWTLRPQRPHVPTKVAAFQSFLEEAFADGPPWARPQEPGTR